MSRIDSQKPLRVCYFGTYRESYARNQILIEGMRINDIDVVECHQTLWFGIEDRVHAVQGEWIKPAFWIRVFKTYFLLIKKYLTIRKYDILMVGYPGQFDVFLAKILSWFRRKPLVWDVLNSLYLISSERGLRKSNPFTTQIIKKIEKTACQLPDMLFLDCQEFINWFKETYDINEKRFRIVPIGADDRHFNISNHSPKNDDVFRVIYYGTYIPNHGVEYIVKSARLIRNDPQIHFEMIGTGPEYNKAVELADEYKLNNITFISWKKREELIEHIDKSNLVLGVFGTTKQVTLTNNNKIYEGFAMMKPVLSGYSPSMPKILQHGTHLYLCERGSPEAITDAIRILKSNPALCKKLETNGKMIFHQKFDVQSIGQQIKHHLDEFI